MLLRLSVTSKHSRSTRSKGGCSSYANEPGNTAISKNQLSLRNQRDLSSASNADISLPDRQPATYFDGFCNANHSAILRCCSEKVCFTFYRRGSLDPFG